MNAKYRKVTDLNPDIIIHCAAYTNVDKAESEQDVAFLVRDFHSKFFIVRTSWVFGARGNNFVKTMLKLSKATEPLTVINDQVGCPTYTVDLSKCIVELMGSNVL